MLTQSHQRAKRYYEICRKELPLSCPNSLVDLWDKHPRVYLPIEKTGYAICPYCETKYFLKEDEYIQSII